MVKIIQQWQVYTFTHTNKCKIDWFISVAWGGNQFQSFAESQNILVEIYLLKGVYCMPRIVPGSVDSGLPKTRFSAFTESSILYREVNPWVTLHTLKAHRSRQGECGSD